MTEYTENPMKMDAEGRLIRKSVLISATRLYVDNQREFIFDMCDVYAIEWNEKDNEVVIYHTSLPETLYIRADWEDIKNKFAESRT